MIKRQMITTALVAAGVLVSLEYISIAQTTIPTTEPTTPTTEPTTPTTEPTTPTTEPTTPTTEPTTPTTEPTTPTTQQNQNRLSALDRQFMIEAAQGGMAEVRLGQLASERAVSDEVKKYGQHMVHEHTQANNELMALATQKGVTLPKDVNAKQKALRARLGQIPGRRFDQMYMSEAGVKSHAEQAALYQREAQQGQDPDVKAFAAKTLPTVLEHLKMARSMTSATTGVNPNRPASSQ